MKHFLKITIFVLASIGLIGIMQSCKKKTTIPLLTTTSVAEITQTSAVSGGNITDDGGAEVTAKGVCWNTADNPTTINSKTSDGIGKGIFSSNLTQLTPDTKYYVRAYATNEAGTSYGNSESFTTSDIVLATLSTAPVSSITFNTAISGGNITSDGGGNITVRGVCWSNTSQTPTTSDSKTDDGSGKGSYTSNLTGLYPGNTYSVRAYAVNSKGTAYGDKKDFVTDKGITYNSDLTYGTLSDIDGNTYKTIQIGAQMWMAENLRTTKFNDGAQITLKVDNNEWVSLTSPGYCWYDNNEYANKAVYGALYNWMAVSSAKLCPTGWHVPLSAEWTMLSDQLGGESAAGGKLKETGFTHWFTPNTGATNESGFTALPGGYRNTSSGAFSEIGNTGTWWSSTESSPTTATTRYINATYGSIYSYNNQKANGFSVRCIRD